MTLIELTTKIKVNCDLDLKNLHRLNYSRLSLKEISKIELIYNSSKLELSDIFNIRVIDGSKEQKKVVIKGSNNFFQNVGFRWNNDLLFIKGNVGSYLGHKMESGTLNLNGSAENFVACQMIGGKIIVDGSVKDYLGSVDFGEKIGMNGGSVLVKKSAGDYLGHYMRRGLIIVNGNVGENCSNHLIAGTIIIKGKIGKNLAFDMKRGTLIINYKEAIPKKKFINCGEQKIEFFNLLKKYFSKDLEPTENLSDFIKYIGNSDVKGFGEILLRRKI